MVFGLAYAASRSFLSKPVTAFPRCGLDTQLQQLFLAAAQQDFEVRKQVLRNARVCAGGVEIGDQLALSLYRLCQSADCRLNVGDWDLVVVHAK